MPSKPYLETVGNDPEQTSHMFEWGRYLGHTFGASQSLNALRYYRDLNWISDEVYLELRKYLRGLAIDELDSDHSVDDPTDIESLEDSPFGVHAESLRYIAKIAGVNFSEEALHVAIAEKRAGEQDFPLPEKNRHKQPDTGDNER